MCEQKKFSEYLAQQDYSNLKILEAKTKIIEYIRKIDSTDTLHFLSSACENPNGQLIIYQQEGHLPGTTLLYILHLINGLKVALRTEPDFVNQVLWQEILNRIRLINEEHRRQYDMEIARELENFRRALPPNLNQLIPKEPDKIFDLCSLFIENYASLNTLENFKLIIEHNSVHTQRTPSNTCYTRFEGLIADLIRALNHIEDFKFRLDSLIKQTIYRSFYKRAYWDTAHPDRPVHLSPIASRKPDFRPGGIYSNNHGICHFLALKWLMAVAISNKNFFYDLISRKRLPERFIDPREKEAYKSEREKVLSIISETFNADLAYKKPTLEMLEKQFFELPPPPAVSDAAGAPGAQTDIDKLLEATAHQLEIVKSQLRLSQMESNLSSLSLRSEFSIPYENIWNYYVPSVELFPKFIFMILNMMHQRKTKHIVCYLGYYLLASNEAGHAMALSLQHFGTITKVLFYDPNYGNHLKLLLKYPFEAIQAQEPLIHQLFSHSSHTNSIREQKGTFLFKCYDIDKTPEDATSRINFAELFDEKSAAYNAEKNKTIFLSACEKGYGNIIDEMLSSQTFNTDFLFARFWTGASPLYLLLFSAIKGPSISAMPFLALGFLQKSLFLQCFDRLVTFPLFTPTPAFERFNSLPSPTPPEYSCKILPLIFALCSRKECVILLSFVIKTIHEKSDRFTQSKLSLKLVLLTPINGGLTPLYVACDNNNIDAVKLLLDHGTAENINTTFGGKTPLQIAQEKSFSEIVSLLQSKMQCR